jgi:hypothetical protein
MNFKKDWGSHMLLIFSVCIMIFYFFRPNKNVLQFYSSWRGVKLINNTTIMVENVDSLPVKKGDTVTVFYDSEMDGYYISDTKEKACDTATFERNIFSSDTTKFRFEAWNVRLEENIQKK